MIHSIRRFLLINLLLALIVITLMTALGNYYLDQRDIERHLDTLLRQSALTFEALLGGEIEQSKIENIQRGLNELPTISISPEKNEIIDPVLTEKYQFQVWNKAGQLILYTPDAPKIPFNDHGTGFKNKRIAHQLWRTYTRVNPALGIRVEAGEQYGMREQLAHHIAEDDVYIMLLTYPLAGLLIWFIIGLGLRSIDRVTEEVSNRLPNYLEPVEDNLVPSEIKPLVNELNKLFLRLQKALEREKRFAGDAAHELRTPLAALKTQAQVALRTTNETERNQILQNVILGVDRCTHVVQQLLTLSRLVPEASQIDDAIPVNLSKLASEIVAQLVPSAIDKQIDIELIPDENVQSTVTGNVTALSILIRNLVDNAIRYTPEGGNIQVRISSTDEKVLLRVTDNGPGIPAELRARVFERFFRVLGNKSPGSGLGLAIVQQIAHLHKAQVKLGPPNSGKGLEVEIAFPRI